jgi:SAM-dependent methyltransferase
VALEIAREGAEVWALDRSPEMVEELGRRLAAEPADVAARVHPLVGDLRAPAPDGPFALIVLAMNTLQVLTEPEDQLACLSAARARLAPGGELIFDVAMPDVAEILGTLGVVRRTDEHLDPATGAWVLQSASYDDFDPVTQTLRFTIVVDDRASDGGLTRRLRRFAVHLFLPSELGHLLARAGLEVVEAYGDFEGNPVDASSPRQIYRCRAAA